MARILPEINDVSPAVKVIVVGAEVPRPSGLDLESLAWSEQAEAEALRRMRIGLYPVDRKNPLAEGKCGYKAVLYMAHGIPPIVTPTTPNASIVREGVDGLYADAPGEWKAAVERLLNDGELWDRMSRSSYERARAEYSVARWGPVVARRLTALSGWSQESDGGR